MNARSLLLACLVVVGAAAATACAARELGGEAGSEEDLTTTIAGARACAARDAYVAATLNDFQEIAASDLPASIRDKIHESATAMLLGASDGRSYYVLELVESEGAVTSLYSSAGALLATARNGNEWRDARSQPLSCSDGSSGGWGSSGGMNDGGSSGAMNDGGSSGAMNDGGSSGAMNDGGRGWF